MQPCRRSDILNYQCTSAELPLQFYSRIYSFTSLRGALLKKRFRKNSLSQTWPKRLLRFFDHIKSKRQPIVGPISNPSGSCGASGFYHLRAPIGRAARMLSYGIRATPVSREYMLDSINGDIITQDGAKERQFCTAQIWTDSRRLDDGAVVLDDLKRTIQVASPLGHEAFLAAQLGKTRDTLRDGGTKIRHMGPIALDLFAGALIGQEFESLFTKHAVDCFDQING